MKNSFRDPVTGVLKAVGFVESNEPGDIKQAEAEDFNLRPGAWKWNGSAWVANAIPAPAVALTVEALAEALITKGVLSNGDVDQAKNKGPK